MATTGWGAYGAGAWSQNPVNSFHVDQEQPLYNSPVPGPQGQTAPLSYAPPPVPQSYQQPPPAPQSYQQPPLARDSFSESLRLNDIEKKELSLRRREAELEAKERQLYQLQAELQSSGVIKRRKNWPICFPMLYHNIAEDIPGHLRRPVREGYMAWLGLVWCLSWNLFCASLILGEDANQKVPSWFLAVIYWISGIPLSFYLWYRRLYNGAKADSNFNFLTFFAFFAVHVAFCIWACIAVPFSANKWSFCGFMTAIKTENFGKFTTTIFYIGAAFWVAEALFSLWVIRDVWWFFRAKKSVTVTLPPGTEIGMAAP